MIEANKLRQAVDYLCEYLSETDDTYHNEAVILKRQITAADSHFRIGDIDYEEVQKQKNKISFAILQLANEICAQAEE